MRYWVIVGVLNLALTVGLVQSVKAQGWGEVLPQPTAVRGTGIPELDRLLVSARTSGMVTYAQFHEDGKGLRWFRATPDGWLSYGQPPQAASAPQSVPLAMYQPSQGVTAPRPFGEGVGQYPTANTIAQPAVPVNTSWAVPAPYQGRIPTGAPVVRQFGSTNGCATAGG
jgi:hypothetical protein